MDATRSSAAHGLDLRFVGGVVARTLLPMWFILSSSLTLYQFASQNLIAIDARLYRFAAIQALSGGDPWAVHADGTAFAGPPPTLLLVPPLGAPAGGRRDGADRRSRAGGGDLVGPPARAPVGGGRFPATLRRR